MLAPVLVLAVAAILRFWALGRPGTLVFDELYYVRDAISQLAHGFATTWPDSDPSLAGERARSFSDEASYVAHPPLGKWLIGLGVLLFGPDNGWGWRSAVALAGVATVAVTMRLGWRLTRSLGIACLAGLLLALDGVHVTLTRVALLDGFLTLAVVTGALFVWRDIESSRARARVLPPPGAGSEPSPAGNLRRRIPILWRRPWLLGAGLVFGAAAGIKWSGLYPLAAFLVLIVILDLFRRRAVAERLALLRAFTQALVTAVIALPTAAVAYLATWTGWIVTADGWGRQAEGSWPAALAKYHVDLLRWHASLTAEHPFSSHPLSWPLALRPTAMYDSRWEEGCQGVTGCVSGVSPLPNLLITWGGVAALLALLWLLLRRTPWRLLAPSRLQGVSQTGSDRRSLVGIDPLPAIAAFVLVGYLSGWIPWVLTVSRSAVFQFYTVVLTPFSALALALTLGLLAGIVVRGSRGSAALELDPDPESVAARRVSVGVFIAAVVLVSAWFFPVWSAIPVPEWFWRAHLWLPGWA